MKKVSVKTAVKKFIAVTAAALMLGSGMAFVSCSSDDGSDNDTDQTVNPENPNPSNPDTPVNPNPSTVEFTAQTASVSVENLGESAASAKSADESIATVEVTDGALSITSVKAGETTVTASKEGYGDAFVKVTVAADGSVTTEVATKFKQRAADAVVTGIAVESNINEFEFGAAEPDWNTILTVRKVYNDESTESVSEGFTVTGWNSSEAGEKELTVTCDGKTTTFKVTIAAPLVLTSIEVSPAAVEIEEGATETDLRAKLTVNAVMSNDSKRDVTDYTISDFYGSKAGEQAVKVSYNEKEAVVTVKVMPWFTSLKFDSAFDGTTEKDYAKADADFVSEDGTWKIIKGVSAAKVAVASANSYNEDTTYTSRIQIKGEALKLKVGKNKSVILRVDGGSASGSGSNRTITAKGANTATWQSFKGAADGKVCAGFLEVTGDANGYVTLSADNNINIYGIKVVESKEDLSTVVLGNTVSYKDTKVELSATEVNKDAEDLTVSASTNAVATPLYADGHEGEAGTPEVLSSFNFYIVTVGEDKKEINTPVETLPTSELGEHTVKAVLYTLAEDGTTKTENSKVTAEAIYKVVDPNAIKYTVTFDAGEGSFAEGATTSFQIEDGTIITTSDIPKPTAPEGKRFKEWTSNVEGLKTDSEITKDVTFTATYEAGFTELFETITSGNTFPSTKNNSTTVTFSSGVSVVSGKGTGTKLETKVVTIDGITSAMRLSLDKAANEASIKIPVSGKSVVKIGFNPSKVARGLTLTSDNELTVNKGETATSVDYTTSAAEPTNEIVTVTANSDITLKVKDPISSAGSVYIYFIDVTASE